MRIVSQYRASADTMLIGPCDVGSYSHIPFLIMVKQKITQYLLIHQTTQHITMFGIMELLIQ